MKENDWELIGKELMWMAFAIGAQLCTKRFINGTVAKAAGVAATVYLYACAAVNTARSLYYPGVRPMGV